MPALFGVLTEGMPGSLQLVGFGLALVGIWPLVVARLTSFIFALWIASGRGQLLPRKLQLLTPALMAGVLNWWLFENESIGSLKTVVLKQN